MARPLRQARVFATWPANGKLVVELPEGFEAKEGRVKLHRAEAAGAPLPQNYDSCRGSGTLAASVASIKPSPHRKGFNLVELKLDREPEPWSGRSSH